MLSELLQSVTGLGGYPAIAILFLFAGFGLVTWFAVGLSKEHLDYMSTLPLDEDDAGSIGEEDE